VLSFVTILLALLGSATSAGGQQAASGSGDDNDTSGRMSRSQEVLHLSLERALELASQHNPEYRQARNELELQGPASRQAWGAFLPNLSLSAGTSQSFSRTEITEDFFGNPIDNPDLRTNYNSGTSQSLSLDFDLFEGGRRFHELADVRAQVESRVQAAELRLIGLRANVARKFFEAQEQAELVRLEQELLVSRERDLEATQRLFALASKSRADLLGAEFELRLQERQLRDVESAFQKALLTLRTHVGDPELPEIELEEESVDIFDPGSLPADRLVDMALARNPQILQERANSDASRAQVSAAKASRWPSVSLSGSLSRSAFGVDQDALFSLNPDDRLSGSMGLVVRIPVFERFTTSYQIAQADVNLQNSGEALRKVELDTVERVKAGLIDLQGAFLAYQIQLQALEVAVERLRIAQEEYRLAGRNFEELQAALRDAAAARRQELDARYQFVESRINLEEVVGTPISPNGGNAPEPGPQSR
jgi:outer membrane protein